MSSCPDLTDGLLSVHVHLQSDLYVDTTAYLHSSSVPYRMEITHETESAIRASLEQCFFPRITDSVILVCCLSNISNRITWININLAVAFLLIGTITNVKTYKKEEGVSNKGLFVFFYFLFHLNGIVIGVGI